MLSVLNRTQEASSINFQLRLCEYSCKSGRIVVFHQDRCLREPYGLRIRCTIWQNSFKHFRIHTVLSILCNSKGTHKIAKLIVFFESLVSFEQKGDGKIFIGNSYNSPIQSGCEFPSIRCVPSLQESHGLYP